MLPGVSRVHTRRARGRSREKIRYLQQLVDAHREFDRLRDADRSIARYAPRSLTS